MRHNVFKVSCALSLYLKTRLFAFFSTMYTNIYCISEGIFLCVLNIIPIYNKIGIIFPQVIYPK